MVLIVFLITSFLIGGTSKGEDLSLTVDVQPKSTVNWFMDVLNPGPQVFCQPGYSLERGKTG
jgi:hypothetical protein